MEKLQTEALFALFAAAHVPIRRVNAGLTTDLLSV